MKKIELLTHNKELYNKIVEQMNKGEKSIFYSQATGLGKSFIFMKLVEDYFQGKRIMYVVPKIAIWNNLISYKEFKTLDATIEMYTYQSFNEYDRSLVDEYDVVFVDECHHMLSDIQGNNLLEYCFDMNKEGKYTFGFTATPYYQGKFVDEECFDVSCYGYDVYEAINVGILPKIKLAMAAIDLDKVPFDMKVQFSITGTKNLLNKIVEEHTEIHRWIAYFANSRELENSVHELSILFPSYKILKTYVGLEDDNTVIDEFNKYADNVILLSVNKLLEGVHLNNVQGVLLYRNVTEFSTYMQMYGRLCDINTKITPLFLDVSNALLSLKDISETKSSRFEGERKVYIRKDLFDITASDYWTVELADMMSKTYTLWSDNEIEILTENYGKIPNKDLYKLLPNRTQDAIRHKIKYLGLFQDNKWSEDEDNILRNNTELTASELVKLLPRRTVYSIKGRRRILGLTATSPDKWTEKELEILRHCDEMTMIELKDKLPNRTENAIRFKRNELNRTKKEQLDTYWTEKDVNILIENYPIIGKKCFEMIKGKTVSQCANKVFKLGIKRERKDYDNLYNYMKQHYDKETNDSIAERFNVTKNVVQHCASKLQLTNTPPPQKHYSDDVVSKFVTAYESNGYIAVKAIPEFSECTNKHISYLARKFKCSSPNSRAKLSSDEIDIINNYIYTNPIIRPTKKYLAKILNNRTVCATQSAVVRCANSLGLECEGEMWVCKTCNNIAHECTCEGRPKGLSVDFIETLDVPEFVRYKGICCIGTTNLAKIFGLNSERMRTCMKQHNFSMPELIDFYFDKYPNIAKRYRYDTERFL